MRTQTKPETLENYLSLTDPITLDPEPDGGCTVMITYVTRPDRRFAGLYSQGDTLEEAIANIQEAKIAWMETAWEYGDEISLPSQF